MARRIRNAVNAAVKELNRSAKWKKYGGIKASVTAPLKYKGVNIWLYSKKRIPITEKTIEALRSHFARHFAEHRVEIGYSKQHEFLGKAISNIQPATVSNYVPHLSPTHPHEWVWTIQLERKTANS